MDIPIWIYFVFAGIVVSSFMAIKTSRKEWKEEMKMIEKEGQIYIERMEKEREERKKLKSLGNE